MKFIRKIHLHSKYLKNTDCHFNRRENSLFPNRFLILPIKSEYIEMTFHTYSEISCILLLKNKADLVRIGLVLLSFTYFTF